MRTTRTMEQIILFIGRTVYRRAVPLTALAVMLCSPPVLRAGDYMDSAHGNKDIGVYRPNIGDAPPQGFGYSKGNCAHCHEQHASIGGSEPGPATGGPSGYTLFAGNFSGIQSGSYQENDDFCFYCHNNTASAQRVLNNDYSQTFGCAGQGTTAVMTTMNQLSYHNLNDISTFAGNTFSWFTNESNPCNGCHNPHLAKQNKAAPTNPNLSVMSRPSDHFRLWGTATNNETMADRYNTAYEPPYCSSASNREPGASADADTGRANTPDYVFFCTDCHNNTNQISSTPLGRTLETIDWANGDRHGQQNARTGVTLLEPYASAGADFVLSCLDCHEPHGAPNIMLLRRRVNGADLINDGIVDNITDLDSAEWGYLCRKCHPDDDAEGTGTTNVNGWEYVHHLAPDRPFVQTRCRNCHNVMGRPVPPISCGATGISARDCHGHGREF